MKDHDLQRLLALIARTGNSEQDEAFCASVQGEPLTAYVELERAKQPAAQRHPKIARHLDVCPDCKAFYLAFHRFLDALADPATQMPVLDGVFDPATQMPRPKPAPAREVAPSRPSLRERIDSWLPRVPRLASAGFRSSAADSELVGYVVKDAAAQQTARVFIDPAPQDDAPTLSLAGYFRPVPHAWTNRPLRLYAIAQAEPFSSTTVDRVGEFAFSDLPQDNYILALELEAEEIPLVIVPRSLWSEQD